MQYGFTSTALAMLGVGRVIGGTDIIIVIEPREPLVPERLFEAYTALVAAHPALCSTFEPENATGAYAWREVAPHVRQKWLEDERARFFEQAYDVEQLASGYRPLNEGFPLVVRRLSDGRYLFAVQHAWADGQRALGWIETLLATYAGEAVRQPATPPGPALVQHPGWRAFLAFLLTCLRRLPGSHLFAQRLADLSGGLPRSEGGFWHIERRLEGPALVELHRLAVKRRSSITEVVCARLASALQHEAPGQNQARFTVPVDVAPELDYPLPGNYVCGWPVQVRLGVDAFEEMRREFRRLGRNVHAVYAYLLERWAQRAPHARVLTSMTSHLGSAHADRTRGYFRQSTLLISNLGVITLPKLSKSLRSLSVFGQFEALGLGMAQTAGTLTISACAPKSRYQRERIARLLARAFPHEASAAASLKSPQEAA